MNWILAGMEHPGAVRPSPAADGTTWPVDSSPGARSVEVPFGKRREPGVAGRARSGLTTTLLAAFVAGCAGLGGGSPAPTPGPSPLPPGTYASSVFQPNVSFTLPAGWWMPTDSAGYLGLNPVESDLVGIHLFRDPLPASQEPSCPTVAEEGVGTLSGELAAWIRGLPGLTVSNPRLVTVGGLRGVEVDARIAAGWTASCPFADGIPTVPLIVGPNESFRWVVAGSERLRLSILDLPGGGTVIVDTDAFEGSLFDTLLAEASPIVRSFVFAVP